MTDAVTSAATAMAFRDLGLPHADNLPISRHGGGA